jgi:tetratricopeptide (TPR) repeat protein
MDERRFQWLGLILIVFLTFAAYSSAIHGGYIWDDDSYVTENHLLTSPNGLWEIWTTTKSPQYYPLVFTAFWVERRLWGLNPMGYHVVNVSLHAINALLVWLLLRKMEVPGAWMVGAVFAVHPVHVESVAWISERKNVLSGMLYLLAVACYLQFESKRHRSLYAGALGLFILALLSKTVVSTLPIALLLIRYLRGWRIGRREVLELFPFLAIGAGMGLLTKWYEVHVVGAQGPEWNLSMGERLLVAGRALAFYVIKLLWPANLIFNYSRWQLDVRDPMQWSWVLVAGAVGLLFWWKRHAWGRGPLVGLGFFSVSLAPALGFFNVYPMHFSFVADHFQYLASIGIIALVIGTVTWELNRWIKPDTTGGYRIKKWIKPVLGSLILVVLIALSWKQGRIYYDSQTLWQDTIEKNSDSWLAHSWLGTILLNQGNPDRALEHIRLSLKINPEDEYSYNNLGRILTKQGKRAEAIENFQHALQIRPRYPEALTSLGVIMASQGRLERARLNFLTAVQLKPDFIEAHYNLAKVYASQGRLELAVQEYLTTLKLKPDDFDAHYNLGNAYAKEGRLQEATREYSTAISLRPDSPGAHSNLGIAYSRQGREDEAIREFLTVVQLRPDDFRGHYNLGIAYRHKGLSGEARRQFEIAIKIKPGFTPAEKALESLGLQSETH